MSRLGLLFSVVLSCALIGAAGAQRRHVPRKRAPHPKAASPKALKGRLGSIKQKKQRVKAELHQTRVQAKVVKGDLHTVNVRLNDVQTRIARTQRDLQGARSEQRTVAGDLRQATSELAKVRELARGRLRAMAKQGESNVLVGLVSAHSVGDLAERQDLMERIARKDHEIFARTRALQARVAERKRRKDALVTRVGALERRQRSQRTELQAVRAQKGRTLANLNQHAGELESELKQFEQDERTIARLIALAARRPRLPGHKPLPRYAGRFRMPVAARITSGFGRRFHPILHIWRLHAGVDFGLPIGSAVHAAAPGEVIAATCMRGFGNVVIVDHGGGVSTVYGHLSHIGVRPGQRVGVGQTVGASGNSGLSTGPHLHWEVHVGGRAVNPMGR